MRRVGRPLAMPVEERRSTIFAGAEQLFGERGYDKVTMSDIAAAVGMSRRTLYSLFTEKDELLRQLISSSYVWPEDADDACAGEPVEQLRLRLQVMANYVLSERHIRLQRLAIAESWDIAGVARTFHETGIERSRTSLIESISKIPASRIVVDLPPVVLSDMLYGATCGHRLVTALLTGIAPDMKQVYETVDALVCRLFVVR